MFTLLKSFQIIKNRKTFEHYCFSTLQCEERRRKEADLVPAWTSGMLVQGDICCLETLRIKWCSPPTPICLPLPNHSALLLPSCSWISPLLTYISHTKTAKLIFAYFPVFCLLHSDKLSGLEEIFWTSDIERAWKYSVPLFNPTFRYGNEDRLWQQGKVFKIFIFDLWLQIV